MNNYHLDSSWSPSRRWANAALPPSSPWLLHTAPWNSSSPWWTWNSSIRTFEGWFCGSVHHWAFAFPWRKWSFKGNNIPKKNVSVFSIFMTIDTFCFPLLGWLAISNEMNCRVACVFGRLVLWKRRIPLWKQKLPVFGEFHTTWARFITNEPLGEGDVFHILSHSSWSESMKWLWFFKAETEVSRNLILNSATYRRFTHGPLRYRS